MIESYAVGVEVALATPIFDQLAALTDDLRGLDDTVKGVMESFGGLNDVLAITKGLMADLGSAFGTLDDAAAGTLGTSRLLNRSLTRMGTKAAGIDALADSFKGLQDSAAGAMGVMSMGSLGMAGGGAEAAEGGMWHQQFMDHASALGEAIMPAIGVGLDATVMGKILHPGMEYGHELALLKAAGMSAAHYRQAKALSLSMGNTIPLTTYSEAAQQINEARMIFGKTSLALQMEPMLARMNAEMSTVTGHKTDFTYQAAKALELQGAWKDPALFAHDLNQMSKIYTATGGRVTPKDYLMVDKFAHGLPMQWSQGFMYRLLPTLIQEFKNQHGGASTVGTMLASMAGNTTGGAVSQRNMGFWIKYGLEKSSDIVTTNSSMWRGFKPGTVVGWKLLESNPIEWVWKDLEPLLAKKGVNIHSKAQVEKAMYQLFQNRNTSGAVFTIMEQHAKFIRDQRLIREAHGVKFLSTMMKIDPTAKWAQITTDLTNLATQISQSWLPMFNKQLAWGAHALGDFSNWANKNKDAMKGLFYVMEGFGALMAGKLAWVLLRFASGPLLTAATWMGRLALKLPLFEDGIAAALPTIAIFTADLVPLAAAAYAAYEALNWIAKQPWVQKYIEHPIDKVVHRALADVGIGHHGVFDHAARDSIDWQAQHPPIIHHTHIHVDGKQVAEAVTTHLAPHRGPTTATYGNPHAVLPYGGEPLLGGG